MLYAFQMDIAREDTSNILRFIGENPKGIFVLPEGAIDLKRAGIEKVIEQIMALTNNGELSVISGVVGDPNSKAYLFAYGEKERIYHIHQQFTLPCCSKKIKAAVRVCAEIKEPYMFLGFQLLVHPSSMDLNTLLGLAGEEDYRGIHSRLKCGDAIIASASFFAPPIICAAGRSIGDKESIKAPDGHKINYVSYEI